MNEEKIFIKIISILNKYKKITIKNKKKLLNLRYLDIGHIDSLKLMSFIVNLEKNFKIKISSKDTESENFRSVKGLITIIKKNVRK